MKQFNPIKPEGSLAAAIFADWIWMYTI